MWVGPADYAQHLVGIGQIVIMKLYFRTIYELFLRSGGLFRRGEPTQGRNLITVATLVAIGKAQNAGQSYRLSPDRV